MSGALQGTALGKGEGVGGLNVDPGPGRLKSALERLVSSHLVSTYQYSTVRNRKMKRSESVPVLQKQHGGRGGVQELGDSPIESRILRYVDGQRGEFRKVNTH